MTRMGRWVMVGMMALGSAALAQGGMQQGQTQPGQQPPSQQPPGQMQQGQQPMGQQPMGAGMQESMSQQDVINHLHHVNQTEVQLAQLAQQRASSDDVKQFAQRLISEHQAADQKLQQLAQRQKMTVGQFQPKTEKERRMQAVEQSSMQLLQQLQGPEFDAAFLTGQVMAHDHAINFVTMAQQQHGSSSALGPLLRDQLTSLPEHRNRAYQLLGQHKAPARQARTPSPSGR